MSNREAIKHLRTAERRLTSDMRGAKAVALSFNSPGFLSHDVVRIEQALAHVRIALRHLEAGAADTSSAIIAT